MKQFAVIGLGRFGRSLALRLSDMNYDVLVVDTDKDRVNSISDRVYYAVQADAMEDQALKSLGIRNFDVVVVAIGQKIQANILVTVLVKEMGVKTVVAKAQNELHGKVLEKVGADMVVYPERDMGARLAHALVSRNIMDQINLSTDYSIIELTAPEEFVGRTLQELALRREYGVTILALRRGEDVLISPVAGERVQEEDILVAIGRNDRLKKLES
jgi:trk system potassium uptake protein TrkA